MRYRVLFGAGLFLLATAALAACGSSATSATTGGSPTASATTIQVTLSDTGVQASETSFMAGTSYHFMVKNVGTVPHAFVLTPNGEQNMPMGQMHQHALLWTQDLTPGQSTSTTYTFPMGTAHEHMFLGCYSQGQGMRWQPASVNP